MLITEDIRRSVVVGVGIDLLEISRIQTMIQRHRGSFLNRVFTLREQTYCSQKFNAYAHYASRFCAKEAFVKALGWGISEKCSWLDVEVIHDVNGRPCLAVSEHVCRSLPWTSIAPHLSISDDKKYAQAMVVLSASVK